MRDEGPAAAGPRPRPISRRRRLRQNPPLAVVVVRAVPTCWNCASRWISTSEPSVTAHLDLVDARHRRRPGARPRAPLRPRAASRAASAARSAAGPVTGSSEPETACAIPAPPAATAQNRRCRHHEKRALPLSSRPPSSPCSARALRGHRRRKPRQRAPVRCLARRTCTRAPSDRADSGHASSRPAPTGSARTEPRPARVKLITSARSSASPA